MAAPHRAPVLDPETADRIRQLIEQGLTRQQVARRLGRSQTQVSKAVCAMGGVEAIRREAEERIRQRQAERDAHFARIRTGYP